MAKCFGGIPGGTYWDTWSWHLLSNHISSWKQFRKFFIMNEKIFHWLKTFETDQTISWTYWNFRPSVGSGNNDDMFKISSWTSSFTVPAHHLCLWSSPWALSTTSFQVDIAVSSALSSWRKQLPSKPGGDSELHTASGEFLSRVNTEDCWLKDTLFYPTLLIVMPHLLQQPVWIFDLEAWIILAKISWSMTEQIIWILYFKTIIVRVVSVNNSSELQDKYSVQKTLVV